MSHRNKDSDGMGNKEEINTRQFGYTSEDCV